PSATLLPGTLDPGGPGVRSGVVGEALCVNSLEQARALLPWWVVWGPVLIVIPVLFLQAHLAGWLGALVTGWPARWTEEMPLSERARQAYPVRRVLAGLAVMLATISFLVVQMTAGPLCPVPAGIRILLAGLAGYVGVDLVFFRVERALRQGQHT